MKLDCCLLDHKLLLTLVCAITANLTRTHGIIKKIILIVDASMGTIIPNTPI